MQNNSQMTCIFFLTPRVNEDIINKDDNEQVQVLFENSIHQIHERCRSINSRNDNNNKFMLTIPSSKGCFWNVTISDFELMITRSEVYLCKMASTLNLVKQVINSGDGILILDCDLVQLSIANVHSEGTIFILYEQHWCTPW